MLFYRDLKTFWDNLIIILIMQGCSTRVVDERQRSENGYDMGPLKEGGVGVSPRSRQAFINVTMTRVLLKYIYII